MIESSGSLTPGALLSATAKLPDPPVLLYRPLGGVNSQPPSEAGVLTTDHPAGTVEPFWPNFAKRIPV